MSAMHMDILAAIDDPAVFGSAFRNPEEWKAWRVFLSALYALPMDEEQLAIYHQCTGRAGPSTAPVYEAWICVGRRGRKSFMLALNAVFLACFKDWRPFLGPGERGIVMVVAQDRKQAAHILEFIHGLLHGSPMLESLIESEREESITLSNRIVIEVHSCNYRAVRGYTVVAVLLDEIAFWRGDDAANPDAEVISAIRPAMATIPGAMMLCASSPYMRKGALWDAYRKHFGKDDDPVLIWQAETRRMNPTVKQSLVDAELEKDPARNRAEYLAEWRSDIEGFVTREAVEACVDPGVRERPPVEGVRYFGFVDPSGGGPDSFALAIAHREDGVAVLDLLREKRAPLSPSVVVEEFAADLKAYRLTSVKGDNYAKEWPIEQFANFGIKYERADKFKSDIYLAVLPLINSRMVRLLDHPRMINQTLDLDRNTSRGGRDSINHPSGSHDDLPNAAFGALIYAAAKPRQALVGCQDGSVIYPDGTRRWPGEEPLRIRTITVNEADMEKEGLRTCATPLFQADRSKFKRPTHDRSKFRRSS